MRTATGFRKADLGRSARLHRAPAARDPGALRQGCGRGLRRRVADHREVVPARQVRARGARHAAHRLQRPPLHGLGRHRLQAGVRRRSLAESRGATSRRPRCCSSIGANIGECSPITTDYIWRCRDSGGKLIVVDPRMTPITRNADLYLPVRPGTDLALLHGHAARHPARRPGGPRLHRARTPPASRRSRSRRSRGTRATAAASHAACRRRRSRRRRTGSARRERAIAAARARPRAPVEGRRELPGA